jgi:glycosyltransferase involved in cell wall biosynthesis
MRLGIVTTSYPRAPCDPAGGFVAEHARWLTRAGHEVDVVAAGDGPGRVRAGAELFYDEGAPDRLARAPRAWWSAARFSLALAAEVRRRQRAWDGIVAHWLVPCGVVAARAGLPAVAIAHSGDVHLLRRLRIVRPVAAALARAGVHVAFVSEQLRALFLSRAGGVALSTSVTPMGIDFDRFGVQTRSSRRRTVLFLGRLVPVKGAAVAIDAMKRVAHDATLCIAGAGPDEAALRARADSDVRFVGEVRGGDRDQLLADADVVVIPSVEVEGGRSEGTPQVLLEAMATGVPVIASRVGGLAAVPANLVDHVAPGDARELARAIERSLAGAGAGRVSDAREWAREHDWSRVGPKLLRALQRSEMNSVRDCRTA